MRLPHLAAPLVGLLVLAACGAETEPATEAPPTAAPPPTTTADRAPEAPLAEAPMTGPEVVAGGAFAGTSRYDVAGRAVVYRLDDGSHVVRLEGLDADNGPDLRVYLVRRTGGDLADGAVDLGGLKSTRGDQNYEVPASADAAAFAGVTVWCRAFSVAFGTAPLG